MLTNLTVLPDAGQSSATYGWTGGRMRPISREVVAGIIVIGFSQRAQPAALVCGYVVGIVQDQC
jgi:hypothetical protein